MTTTDNVTITLEQMTSFRSGAKLLDNGYYELSYGEGKLYINSNADLSNFFLIVTMPVHNNMEMILVAEIKYGI